MRRGAGEPERRGRKRQRRAVTQRRKRRRKTAHPARPPAAELKREIERRLTGGTCAYCGAAGRPERPLTREHVIPRSRGAGRREWRVIVPACLACNRRRGAEPLVTFLLSSPARLSHVLAYLASLPSEALRHVDLRVFAELLAAIALRSEATAGVERKALPAGTAVPERVVRRRRRAARQLLERLREGGGPGEERPAGVAVLRRPSPVDRPARRLAAVLALAWKLPEGRVAGELCDGGGRCRARPRATRDALAVAGPGAERAVA